MSDCIIIIHENSIYNIKKEPFETDENAYKRCWFIIKNQLKFNDSNELISRSIIYLNENKNNMIY
jgi:hypothetical protein